MSSGTDKFQIVKNALPLLMNVCKQQLPKPACGFTVGVELRMTADRGIGVFTTEFIPAGTQIYSDYVVDYTFDHSELVKLLEIITSREEREFFLEHCWGGPNGGVNAAMAVTDACFINHSREPTILYLPLSEEGFVIRDLYPGDEITEDYRVQEGPLFLKDIRLEYGLEFYKWL